MISDPTPVISSTKQIDSGSVSRFTLASKRPTRMYVYTCRSCSRLVSPSRVKKAITP